MVVQYLFHYSYAEGTQSYLAILATVKRFVVVVKNLCIMLNILPQAIRLT